LVDLTSLQQKLGVSFKDTSLLDQALIHSSYINENPDVAPISNERLEFLGDAVLGLVIAEKLYQDFPESDEGQMTRLRAALVRRETLAQIAGEFDLGNYLLLGKGEEAGGGRTKPVNLAGALESLFASIYLDQGLDVTRAIILKLFSTEIIRQAHQISEIDYKSKLQEIIQAQRQQTPSYHTVEAVGPDHARQFTVEVKVGDTVLGQGVGKSKKSAEMEAARSALEAF
jgi:ribonuclease-3